MFAWFLFAVTGLIGTPVPVDEAVATADAELYLLDTLPNSPAAAVPAGAVITELRSGDTVLAQPTPTSFKEFVQTIEGTPMMLEYRLGDTSETVTITPTQGLIVEDPEQFAVGASLSLFAVEQKGFLTAVADGFTMTWQGLLAITTGLWTLLSQAVTGDADLSQVAGPVGIVGMVGDAASYGITALLTFTAIISLNLAVINLLPFPALDGGRLVFVAIESVTRKQIPPVWAGRVNLVGFALLMLLMVAVTYNDILRLL